MLDALYKRPGARNAGFAMIDKLLPCAAKTMERAQQAELSMLPKTPWELDEFAPNSSAVIVGQGIVAR